MTTPYERLAFANVECFKTYIHQKFDATVLKLEVRDDRTVTLQLHIGNYARTTFGESRKIADELKQDLQKMFEGANRAIIDIFTSETYQLDLSRPYQSFFGPNYQAPTE